MSQSLFSKFHRTDLPRYVVFSNGQLVEDTLDLSGFAWEGRVSFYLGCSYSFEGALMREGIEIRNISQDKVVSVYQSNVKLCKVGAFGGNMIITMRPFPPDVLEKVFEIASRFPDCHGAPIHMGDPLRLGLVDLNDVIAGESVTVKDGEVPVFWGCGVTGRNAVMTSSKFSVLSRIHMV